MDEQNERRRRSKSDWDFGWNGRSGGPRWMTGLILILLGFIFLAGNLTGFQLDNWWALFILIPAVQSLSRAFYRIRDGGLGGKATRDLFWGGFFVLLSAAFLVGINFSVAWPAFLILAGLGMLFRAL